MPRIINLARFCLTFLAIFVGATAAVLYPMQASFIFPAPQLSVDGFAHKDFDPISVATPDGENLFALHHPAQDDEATILVFHGNGDAAVRQTDKGKALADAGFGVLLVEYRGYPGSSGRPSEKGLFIDGLAAYDFIKTRTDQPIGLYAHSLGTGVALKIAAEREVFAVVLESPYDSIQAIAQKTIPWLPMQLLLKHKFRSDLLIEKVGAPIFMMHGEKDAVIPIDHAQNLLQHAPEGTIFETIKGAGHNNLWQFRTHEKAIEFFKAPKKS